MRAMKRFEKRVETIKAILLCIEDHPTQYTPLLITVLRDSTPWLAQSTIQWLLKERYIERPSRGTYKITEKGQMLLQAIAA